MPVALIMESLDRPNHVFIIPAQPDMSQSVIASGCIDFVLSPEEIDREIVRITHAVSRANHPR